MADFEIAFKECMKHEGGYANNPSDHGGETYMGISRKNWLGWEGWSQIDRLKQSANFPKCLDTNADLQVKVKTFYLRNFWTPLLENIKDQALANWLFDKEVNMGNRQAIRLLQRALGINVDGIVGQQTKAILNASDPVELLAKCREQAKAFYISLVMKDHTQEKFLKGWLNRA